jgi:flagella basal body P-ring formation protein FlgA
MVAQTQAACGADGARVVARRWDAVLGVAWELRQSCAHPEWPARSVAIKPDARIPAGAVRIMQVAQATSPQPRPAQPQFVPAQIIPAQPLLVHAGDPVRLWMQDATVRIELAGVAEQSARGGERVVVRIEQQTEDAGLTVQRIAGVVRGAGDVEMER